MEHAQSKTRLELPPAAYTIPEFCAAHRISLALYYKLRKNGKGPREAHAGRRAIVTVEAAAEWREAASESENV